MLCFITPYHTLYMRHSALCSALLCCCSDYLALVCIMHTEHFSRRALLDYNIDVFRGSLLELIGGEGTQQGGGGDSAA
mgnify:CR=1 FL=1